MLALFLLFSGASCTVAAGNQQVSGDKPENETAEGFEWPENEGLYPIIQDSLYGYINDKGEVVIEPQFDLAAQFSEGLAYFEQGGKYGFINPKGEVTIPAIYEKKKGGWLSVAVHLYGETWFSEGLAAVRVNGKMGYINQKGEMVIAPTFLDAEAFQHGLAVVKTEAGMYYINKKGEQQFGRTFVRAVSFSDSLAGVMVDQKMGFINTSGKMVIQPQYYTAGQFIKGYTVVKDTYQSKTWKLIDKTGKTILEKQVDRMRVSGDLLCFSENLNEGYMDFKGKIIVPANFDMVMGFFDDIAIAKKDSKEDVFGIINRKGEWVVQPTYEGLWPAGKNMITVTTKNRELGYIDGSGKEIRKPTK